VVPSLCRIGRLPQAIQAFEEAIAQNGTNTNARVGLGEAFIAAGQYQDAEDTARAAVKSDPKYYGSYGLLAQALRENIKEEESLDAFERMLVMNPVSV